MRDKHTTYTRHIKLTDIRQKMLDDHSRLGLLRDSTDDYFKALSNDDIRQRLTSLNMPTDGDPNDQRDCLIQASRTRYIKVWHDHSDIAGHGHLLVLVGAIYDPALYFTDKELLERGKKVDVQSLVEYPYIHMLGRTNRSSMSSVCNAFKT